MRRLDDGVDRRKADGHQAGPSRSHGVMAIVMHSWHQRDAVEGQSKRARVSATRAMTSRSTSFFFLAERRRGVLQWRGGPDLPEGAWESSCSAASIVWGRSRGRCRAAEGHFTYSRCHRPSPARGGSGAARSAAIDVRARSEASSSASPPHDEGDERSGVHS